MSFQQLTESDKGVLKKQLDSLKEEQQDLDIQVEEIDLQINKTLDLQVKLRKRTLKDVRHNLMDKKFQNAQSIANLENVIYRGGYDIKTTEEGEENGR